MERWPSRMSKYTKWLFKELNLIQCCYHIKGKKAENCGKKKIKRGKHRLDLPSASHAEEWKKEGGKNGMVEKLLGSNVR